MDIDDGEDLEEALMRECAAAQARCQSISATLYEQLFHTKVFF